MLGAVEIEKKDSTHRPSTQIAGRERSRKCVEREVDVIVKKYYKSELKSSFREAQRLRGLWGDLINSSWILYLRSEWNERYNKEVAPDGQTTAFTMSPEAQWVKGLREVRIFGNSVLSTQKEKQDWGTVYFPDNIKCFKCDAFHPPYIHEFICGVPSLCCQSAYSLVHGEVPSPLWNFLWS